MRQTGRAGEAHRDPALGADSATRRLGQTAPANR